MPTPSQDAADWSQVKQLYEAAADLAADQREAFLAAAEASEAVRAEVRSLLAHDPEATDAAVFLDAPARLELPASPARIGERLGAWQVVRFIDAGGMGDVFEARRADGSYDGRAAIKVVKRGMDSAAVLGRFAQEQQALATLVHPNIARLLDAGLTADGLPYFVMELVDGRPIDACCEGLALEARLGLFLQLTSAVAYAHRMLLVHRDLKPTNVLVTAEGQVKLLDFGIAKALAANDSATTAADLTLDLQRPFTPTHASPEQVRGERVGTATDIYSLGVLLYELLTGQRPYGRGATTPAEAARAVLEEEPTRPSRLSPIRSDDLAWLKHRDRLKGDLDNILLKALEKPVERRYPSVDALSADVRACLTGHPVSAREPTRRYLLAKFVARNRVSVAAGVAAAAALAIGLGVATWQGHEARVARDEANRRLADVRAVTRDLVFRFGDSITYLPGGMKVKEEMLQDVLRSLDRLAQSSDRDPGLQSDVANTYARLAELQGNDQSLSLAKPDAARINADKAIAIATGLLPQRRDDWKLAHWTARAYDTRAKVLRGQDRPREGLRELDAAQAVLAAVDLGHADDLGRASIPVEHASILILEAQLLEQLAQRKLATSDEVLAKLAAAEAVSAPMLEQRALLERLDLTGRPEEAKAYASILSQMGALVGVRERVYMRLDQLDRALEEELRSVGLHQRAVDYDRQTSLWKDGLATEANHLSIVRLRRGEYLEALAAAEIAQSIGAKLAKEEGPASKWARQLPQLGLQQGRALIGVGRPAEALPLLETAATYWVARIADAPSERVREVARRNEALCHASSAAALQALGRSDAAIAEARIAVAALRALVVAEEPARENRLAAAEALVLLGDLRPAERVPLRTEALGLMVAADAETPVAGVHRVRYAALQAGSAAPR